MVPSGRIDLSLALSWAPSPSGGAHKGRCFADLTLALVAFSLSRRQMGRNTYPCQFRERVGVRGAVAAIQATQIVVQSPASNVLGANERRRSAP